MRKNADGVAKRAYFRQKLQKLSTSPTDVRVGFDVSLPIIYWSTSLK